MWVPSLLFVCLLFASISVSNNFLLENNSPFKAIILHILFLHCYALWVVVNNCSRSELSYFGYISIHSTLDFTIIYCSNHGDALYRPSWLSSTFQCPWRPLHSILDWEMARTAQSPVPWSTWILVCRWCLRTRSWLWASLFFRLARHEVGTRCTGTERRRSIVLHL